MKKIIIQTILDDRLGIIPECPDCGKTCTKKDKRGFWICNCPAKGE